MAKKAFSTRFNYIQVNCNILFKSKRAHTNQICLFTQIKTFEDENKIQVMIAFNENRLIASHIHIHTNTHLKTSFAGLCFKWTFTHTSTKMDEHTGTFEYTFCVAYAQRINLVKLDCSFFFLHVSMWKLSTIAA